MLHLIPIKCFTCGTLIADKYEYYCEEVRRRKINNNDNGNFLELKKVIYMTKDFSEKTIEGEVLDEIGLIKICCRKHILTQV